MCCRANQMIRLTQTELVHDKKQQDSSAPDESAAPVKKEADADRVTSQGADQASSGRVALFPVLSLNLFLFLII